MLTDNVPVPLKQSFLDSLKGLLLADAEKRVRDAGLTPDVVPHGMAITAIARPNTVILWVQGAVVMDAEAGDPLQVENDT